MRAGRNSLIVVLCAGAIATAADHGSATIKAYDREGCQAELKLSVDGREFGRVQFTGTDKSRDVAQIDWPPAPKVVTVAGTFQWTHDRLGKPRTSGVFSCRVIDLAELTRTLRDSSKPFGERLLNFQRACEAFVKKHPEFGEDGSFELLSVQKTSLADISAAEKRLGYQLPTEHVSLLQSFGAFTIDDSYVVPAPQLKNAFEQMAVDWETPHASLNRLPASSQKFYRSSVLLFTEVGDGLGGLAYRPGTTEFCEGQPTFHWTHQDSIDEPRLLKNHDGKCKNYSDAMIWLLAQQALQRLESAGLDVIFIDSSSKTRLPYVLESRMNPRMFSFELRLDWERFE